MKRFKGTPAPWVVDEWSMTGINSESKHVALVNYSHHGLPNDVYGDEHNANAYLIAAAPELLALLIKLDRIGGLGLSTHKEIQSVIAKALGQQ
ncbi:hypothetical protein [Providencia rettgeri]|uniref:hypothetical protein n=1 Tax=Providencia rettgeri TaxID=587 RepID=UPI0032DA59A4